MLLAVGQVVLEEVLLRVLVDQHLVLEPLQGLDQELLVLRPEEKLASCGALGLVFGFILRQIRMLWP